jgi:hypothetical protein
VQCDMLTKSCIPPHFIDLDCNWSLIFYVYWCNIFTVTTFHSLLFPLIKYLLTYFFSYGKYYIFHIGKLQNRMHCESTICMTVYKKDKVCEFGCVCCLLQYFLFIVLCDFHCHAVITFYKWELIENGRLWIHVSCAPIFVDVLK